VGSIGQSSKLLSKRISSPPTIVGEYQAMLLCSDKQVDNIVPEGIWFGIFFIKLLVYQV
jgi:hypothetical protein